MIVQNKAGFTGGSRITFLSSWHRIKISVANEARIILEVVDYEGNCIAYLGVYPKDTFNKLGYKAKINTHTTSYIN